MSSSSQDMGEPPETEKMLYDHNMSMRSSYKKNKEL